MPLGYVFYRQFSGLPVETTAWDMGCIYVHLPSWNDNMLPIVALNTLLTFGK